MLAVFNTAPVQWFAMMLGTIIALMPLPLLFPAELQLKLQL